MPVLYQSVPRLVRLCLAAALLSAHPVTGFARAPALPAEDVMTSTLAGEFAYQAGQTAEAAHWYLKAAQASEGDIGLAARATYMALRANDTEGAGMALALWHRRAPDSLAMRSSAAMLDLRKGQDRRARRELERLLRMPDPQAWRFTLMAVVNDGRNLPQSAELLGKLVDSGAIPDRIEAWQEFGRLALNLDRPDLAKRIVDQMIRRFPQDPQVGLLQAAQLQQAGKPAQAREILDGLVPKVGTDVRLRGLLALAYEASGDGAAAAAVLARGEQDIGSYGLRASILARLDDKGALVQVHDQLRADTAQPDQERRLLLGKIAEFLANRDEALDWYRSVVEEPQRTEARLRTASVLYDLGRRDEAWDETRKLQEDGLVDDEARRDAYLLEAELRQKAGDDAGELDVYARGLAAYPDDSRLLYSRALAWERRDDVARAEADLRTVLVANPNDAAALNALGYTLADRTTRYREALELLDRARNAAPDNPAILDSYGWVLYRLGRGDEALPYLRRAWMLMKDPEVAAHLGEVLWMQGHKDEARKYLEDAMKLDPDNRSLKRVLDRTGALQEIGK